MLAYCLASGTSKRHRRCMDICLSFGADPNVSNEAERPTLVRACEDSVELETLTLMLLEKGANPSVYEKVSGAGSSPRLFVFLTLFIEYKKQMGYSKVNRNAKSINDTLIFNLYSA